VNVGLSFLRGLVAAVNPCGFVLLPTYLMFFLGLEADRVGGGGSSRASVRRALAVASAVSAGFVAVFVTAGTISTFLTRWIERNSKYANAVIGMALVVFGVAMLFGYRLPFATPQMGTAGRDRTVRSMFVYGIAYAVASLGCTLPLFLSTVFSAGERDGVGAGVVNGAAYAAGMSLLVIALTITLAVANHALVRTLRSVMRHVQLVAAALVVVAGIYLLYYFVVVDVRGDTDSVTAAVERLQNWVTVRLNDHWEIVGLALVAVVGAAALYVAGRRHGSPPTTSVRMADDR